MQDRDLVAAVVAGEPAGLAEAYDRYAASLYAHCRSMLPRADAAEAVRDTFLIAVSRLDGLRDPDRLDAWLHAVARNECLRRPGAGEPGASAAVAGQADPDDLPAPLPAGLRGQVLTACADNSPTGRAHRVSVTHRAGAFGPSGFPKAIGPAGPPWWQQIRRHPRPVAAAAVTVAVAAMAGITVVMTAGGSQRAHVSALELGGGPAGSSPIAAPVSGSVAASPTHKAAPPADPPTPFDDDARERTQPGSAATGNADALGLAAADITVRLALAVAVALPVRLAEPGPPADCAGQPAAHLA